MAVKTERELAGSAAEVWKRARAAAEAQNNAYAISLLQSLLKTEPAFLEGRRRLRAVEIREWKGLSLFRRRFLGMKTGPLQMKAAASIKKSPAEALGVIEEWLAIDPYHEKANALLAEAGLALGLPEIALLAYETLADARPNETKNLHRLAELCVREEDFERAIDVYERIVLYDPRDAEAQRALKDTAARMASRSGGWEKGGDFRQALRSAAKTDDGASIEVEMARVYEAFQADPENTGHARRLAELCEARGDLEGAIDWYHHLFERSGGSDAALEKKIGDLRIAHVEAQLAEARRRAEAGETAYRAYAAELEAYRGELGLHLALARVERYPSEKLLHYELGRAHVALGQYREALAPLQEGRKQPSVRLEAANLLGLCHWKLGMLDLAERGLTEAVAEAPAMNAVKKELLFHLGSVLEAAGKEAEALAVWKRIYEADIAYRDGEVARRVEASYRE